MEENLCIFCFYNRDGMVMDYITVLLDQLAAVSRNLIFVVNGKINEEGIQKISKYTSMVIIRDNIGRDYGAYRHVILDYLGKEELKKYSNIILCNDTFIGFFRSFKDIFEEMGDRDADLWGINMVKRGILDHIQSYLLVFGSRMIGSGYMWNYFLSNEIEDKSFGETGALAETKMYRDALKAGYKLDSYIHTGVYSIYAAPYICVTKYKLPIIKIKSFIDGCCDRNELTKTIRYLSYNKLYDENIIEKIPMRTGTVESAPMKHIVETVVNEEELLEFAKSEFYIFGAGFIAKELYYTYFKNNRYFRGFVVSKKEIDDGCYLINEIPPDANIILGVNYEIQKEIIEIIPKSMNKLVLWK